MVERDKRQTPEATDSKDTLIMLRSQSPFLDTFLRGRTRNPHNGAIVYDVDEPRLPYSEENDPSLTEWETWRGNYEEEIFKSIKEHMLEKLKARSSLIQHASAIAEEAIGQDKLGDDVMRLGLFFYSLGLNAHELTTVHPHAKTIIKQEITHHPLIGGKNAATEPYRDARERFARAMFTAGHSLGHLQVKTLS